MLSEIRFAYRITNSAHECQKLELLYAIVRFQILPNLRNRLKYMEKQRSDKCNFSKTKLEKNIIQKNERMY